MPQIIQLFRRQQSLNFWERVEAMLSSENSKFLTLQQQARQQSDQQLNELLQIQSEINMQQKQELLELRKFRTQYEHLRVISGSEKQVEVIKTSLVGIKFPTTKQDIQSYVEQNKKKIDDADSITAKIAKLPSKEYTSIQELVNEMSR